MVQGIIFNTKIFCSSNKNQNGDKCLILIKHNFTTSFTVSCTNNILPLLYYYYNNWVIITFMKLLITILGENKFSSLSNYEGIWLQNNEFLESVSSILTSCNNVIDSINITYMT